LILRKDFDFERAFNFAKIYSMENGRYVPAAATGRFTCMDATSVMRLPMGRRKKPSNFISVQGAA
jgi:hypothetical protein